MAIAECSGIGRSDYGDDRFHVVAVFWVSDKQLDDLGKQVLIDNVSVKHVVLVIRGLHGRSGGAERIYCELANLLSTEEYRVTCLYFDPKGGRAFYPLSPLIERINLYGRPSKRELFWAKMTAIFQGRLKEKAAWRLRNGFFIRQLRDYFTLVKPDVAISILPPANTATLLAAVGTSVKVIACNHNVPEQDYENPERWGADSFDRDLRLRALDNATAIHVLFPDFAKWFPEHLQDKIFPIPNYISPALAWPEPRPVRENLILAVGRLADVKNYIELIRAWSELAEEFPQWRVKIFGAGPQRQELVDEISRLRLGDTIELAGHSENLGSEYARSSIFCHPALFEGFGLSVAEALHMGVPIVFFADCKGVNEFVVDGYNGLAADREKAGDFARALRRLMLDGELRRNLGERGPDSVSHFTYESYRLMWLALLKQIEEKSNAKT